jgi:hypothetical protein
MSRGIIIKNIKNTISQYTKGDSSRLIRFLLKEAQAGSVPSLYISTTITAGVIPASPAKVPPNPQNTLKKIRDHSEMDAKNTSTFLL